jgi:hypothetical protein
MKHMVKTALLIALIVPLFTGTCGAQSQTAAPAIDPQADKILQALTAQKKKDIRASAEVFDTMDEVLKTGQKIQYSHVRKLKISDPKLFWIESTGDITNTTIWKDEKTVTLLDRASNAYSQAAAPGTIDETLDMLVDKYGVRTPLADLLSNNLYSVLMKNVRTCRYLGLHYAEGVKCHHIAATQKDIDWQIWVENGDVPRLRKIVITYKRRPASPQYTAVLKNYAELASVPEDTFTFKAPDGAIMISMLPVIKRAKQSSAKGE